MYGFPPHTLRVVLPIVAAVAVSVACGSRKDATPATTPPTSDSSKADPPAGSDDESGVPSALHIGAVTSDAERAELQSLLDRGTAILQSEEFRSNMEALAATHPVVYANPDRPRVSIREVMALLTLSEPGLRQIEVAVALVGSESYGGGPINYAAYTGPTGAFDNVPSPGSMSIGRVNMYRYRQWNPEAPTEGDIVDHSCAINTITHEIAHTISTHPELYRFAFMDSVDRKDKSTPLASYLIGSVAQCTYLEMHGRIQPDNLAACVEVFGTHNFNNLRCPAFSGGQPVAPRDGLPPPANPL